MRIGCLWIIISVVSLYCNNSPKDNWIPSKDNAHFYAYPLRDSFSKDDSFRIASQDSHFFNSFQEDNLSFSLPQQPIYRLVYFPAGLDCYSAILILTKKSMTIKETVDGCQYKIRDIEEIDSIIRRNINWITDYFLLEYRKGLDVANMFRDSINTIYPNAISFESYREYENTVYDFSAEGFSYITRIIPISTSQWNYFSKKIDSSGFWGKPVDDNRCAGSDMHQGSYLLEAATSERYNNVSYGDCYKDSSAYRAIIDELLDFSGIEKNYKTWFEIRRKKWERTNP